MTGRKAELVAMLGRRRWLVAATVAATLAAAAAVSLLLPPVWRAEATLAVALKADAPAVDREAVLAAQRELLLSPELHRQVLSALGATRLYPGAADEGEAATAFARDLRVDAAANRRLRLAYDGRDPQQVAYALTVLIKAYDARRRQLASAAGGKQAPERRLAAARQEYADLSAKLAALRQDHRTHALTEQRPLLLRQRAQLDLDLKDASSEVEGLESKLNTLREQLAQTPRTIPLSVETERLQIVDDAKGKLLELELKEQELLGRYKESSQFVQSVREEMARVRTFLGDAQSTAPSRLRSGTNVVYQELQKEALSTEATLNALRRRKSALQAQLGGVDRDVADMATREAEVRDLEAKTAAARDEVAQWQREVDAMRAAGEDLHRHASVAVETPALAPSAPLYPRPWRDLPLALVLGIFLGVGAALLAERFTVRLATPQAVERRLGVPVLASLAFRP